MANQEAIIAEYSALRQEISGAQQKQMQTIGAVLAVVSVFIVYGFQAQSSLAFLFANIISVGTIYLVADGRRHISLVATYLSTIVEPKLEGLQWETMLAESHKRENRLSLRNVYQIAIFAGALFTVGSIFFMWLFLKDYRALNLLLYSCLTVILGVSFIIVSVYALRVTSNQYRSDCIRRWKKIEEDLSLAVAAMPYE